MSIFTNPDFLALRPLDLDNKLFLPTSELYRQTISRLNTFYHDVNQVLGNLHDVIAAEARGFYDHPFETATNFYDQMVAYGAGVYALVSEQILPRAEATFRQIVDNMAKLMQQTGEFWQAFYDNPEAATVSLIEPVAAQLSSMIDASQSYLEASLEASVAYLISVYSALVDFFKLLLDQPSATLYALYQNTLAALLDVYFDLVSSLLSLI